MRTLLILNGRNKENRKSIIDKYGLSNYIISLKQIKSLLGSPVLGLNGHFQPFYQKDNEKYCYDLFISILQKRMYRGELLVIETDSQFKSLLSELRNLSIEHRYHVFSLQCHSIKNDNIVSSENEQSDFYNMPKWIKNISDFNEIDNYWIDNLTDKYKEIKVFGDLQGCYSVLQKALPNGIEPDTKYVFIGDFLDRGVENKKVFDFITSIQYLPNVTLIEGNHETHINNFANNKTIHNSGFITDTLPELLNLDKDLIKKEIKSMGILDKGQMLNCVLKYANHNSINELKERCKRLYQKCNQIYLFEFHNKKFLCVHGGLSAVPQLVFIPTKNLISGSGLHSEGNQLTEIYKSNFYDGKCQNFIQIFGHRVAASNEVCYNLIDSEKRKIKINDIETEIQGVEYGGKLPVLTITHNDIKMDYYQNDIWQIPDKIRN